MTEHSDVHETRPGKCPRCRMTLIPIMVKPAAQASNQMSSSVGQPLPKLYTCPMAIHADVVSDTEGICPKCQMKLVETSTVSHGKIAEQHWKDQHSGRRD